MSDQLILFTRFPEPGRVKTRLIPYLGEKGAADLHRQLTEHCVHQIIPAASDMHLSLHIFYTGGSSKLMRKWFPKIPLVKQQGLDLGQRMATALTDARTRGEQRILLFGADCPELDINIVQIALEMLKKNDLIFGPTFDGGYYLFGIGSSFSMADLNILLADISWGTTEVLQQTLTRANTTDYTYSLLPTLHDIDRPEDLEYFHHHARS